MRSAANCKTFHIGRHSIGLIAQPRLVVGVFYDLINRCNGRFDWRMLPLDRAEDRLAPLIGGPGTVISTSANFSRQNDRAGNRPLINAACESEADQPANALADQLLSGSLCSDSARTVTGDQRIG